jgi:transcription initiation factor IIF auxiliary subunit
MDRGSNIERALQLVVDKGCATIASVSAHAHYLERPSAFAFQEASLFRASGYSRLTSGSLVRAALRQGNLVVVGVNTDPKFNSGRYRLFTRQLQKEGRAVRDPNSPHGRHAMCIVGYDDSIGGFLFMNSWGSNWGSQVDNYRGHCWVSYELVKSIGPGAEFVNSAYALHDRKEKIGRDVTPRPDLSSLTVLPLARHAGLHGGKNVWTWSAQLAGDWRALEQVTEVTWSIPGSRGETRAAVASKLGEAFRVVGELRAPGRYPLSAQLRLPDGSSRTLRGELVIEVPTTRSFELVQTDRYWGRVDGQPNWEWTLQLKGSLTDLADVRGVTYHLHRTFRNPNPVVTGTAQNDFAFTTQGWGTFRVRATVTLKDGSTTPLAVGLQFRDPVRDTLTLRNTARPTGTNKFGKDYYDWTAYLDGPLNQLRNITLVRYKLHPTFRPQIRDVSTGVEWGFPLSTSGWGVFELGAEIVFRGGRTEELRHRLQFRGVAGSLYEK